MMKKSAASALLALLLASFAAPTAFAQSELDEDLDGDGVINRFDNCHVFANPLQLDADADGYGNVCDADFDNNGTVDFVDFNIIAQNMFTTDPLTDLNSDGNVNFLDLSIFSSKFGSSPGPALVITWTGGTGSWSNPDNWLPAEVPVFPFHYAMVNTEDSEFVTVEEFRFVSAKGLSINGNLTVCGNLFVGTATDVTGLLTIDCYGRLDSPMGIDLDGQLDIKLGVLRTGRLSSKVDANSELLVRGPAEFEGTQVNERLVTDIDITIFPGGSPSQFGELFLEDATVKLISETDNPASYQLPNSKILGTGAIEFYGPSDPAATGRIFSFGTFEFGPDINVFIEPGAYAYLDGQIVNYGDIDVTDSATLLFNSFSFFTNSGQIQCSNAGGLKENGSIDAGDSVLVNSANSSVTVENCATTWPTRIVNQGTYEVTNSELNMPLIGANGAPLFITNSDISIKPFQPPIPSEFFVFDPANENTVFLKGQFFLANQSLTIDASQWRFTESGAARISGGTLFSSTPLNVNPGSRLTFDGVDLNAEVTLSPASEMVLEVDNKVRENIRFLEATNCQTDSSDPATLRLFNVPLTFEDDIEVSAVSASQQSCLQAQIVSNFSSELPELLDVRVVNAKLKIDGPITLNGNAIVSSPGAELAFERVTSNGTVTCFNEATLKFSGTSNRPFVNNGNISTSNCNVSLSDYWQNDGSLFTTSGSLSLSGVEGETFKPGSGTYIFDDTSVAFNLELGDSSQLGAFSIVTSDTSTFTFGGRIANAGPTFDLSDFPLGTVFNNGFELYDTTVTGNQIFQLAGTTTLGNVELWVNTIALNGATVNVIDQLGLNSTFFEVKSNSPDGAEEIVTKLAMQGPVTVSGFGAIFLEAVGSNARSDIVQGVANMPINFSVDSQLFCVGGGQCRVGENAGQTDLLGRVSVQDSVTRLNFLSDVLLHDGVMLRQGANIYVAPEKTLEFTGPNSALAMELLNGQPNGPAVVAQGNATLNVGDAKLFFTQAADFELESGTVVTVLSHEGYAVRVGEFADVSGAQVDGQPFAPDYSSPDVTVFRGPLFE